MTFRTYDEAYGYLVRATNYEVDRQFAPASHVFKLERVTELMERVGHPQREWTAVHIAGTKGKGSTAAMTERILREAGLRTGLYTSPHVAHLRERVQSAGEWIREDAFARVMSMVAEASDEMRRRDETRKPTFFEMMTAAAFLFFRDEGIEAGVVETGLGGRLDATNVLVPAVCAITQVGLDHMEVLGHDVVSIAREKGGILKEGVPAVTGCTGEALDVIEQMAAQGNVTLEVLGRDLSFERESKSGEGEEVFSLRTPERSYSGLRINLPGLHQVSNAAIAVRLAERIGERDARVDERAVREGLTNVRWAARIEMMGGEPRVVVDAAHNVDSAQALVATLREKLRWGRLILIVGMSSDKDCEGFLSTVLPVANVVVATASNSYRALAPGDLGAMVRRLSDAECVEAPGAREALAVALGRADAGDIVVVSGSFYLAGEVKEALRGCGRHQG